MSDFQLGSFYDESCPNGTIPIRRVTEQDMLRAYSINSFGTKLQNQVPHDVCNHIISIIFHSISFFFNFHVFYLFMVHKDSKNN